MHVDLPHGVPITGTQAQTAGSGLKRLPGAQVCEALQIQMPAQSAPPWFGSQSSLGSSMHVPEPTSPTRQKRMDALQAVTLALRNNPEYRASALDIRIAEQDVLAEEGRYPYVFNANAGFTRQEQPNLGPNDSVTSRISRTYNVGTGLSRTFPFGTRAEVRVDGRRFENEIRTDLPGNHRHRLRGDRSRFGDSARYCAVSGPPSAKRNFAPIAPPAARVQGGALSLAELLTFQTRVAQLEESVVAADTTKRQRSLDLGQLIGSSDESTPQFVAATEPPNVGATATRADVEAALRSGSIELAELEAQVRVARIRAEAAGDDSRPRLDLEGFVESEGVSERVPRAFERAGRMGWITAHVGAVFELPLDNTQLNASAPSRCSQCVAPRPT